MLNRVVAVAHLHQDGQPSYSITWCIGESSPKAKGQVIKKGKPLAPTSNGSIIK